MKLMAKRDKLSELEKAERKIAQLEREKEEYRKKYELLKNRGSRKVVIAGLVKAKRAYYTQCNRIIDNDPCEATDTSISKVKKITSTQANAGHHNTLIISSVYLSGIVSIGCLC